MSQVIPEGHNHLPGLAGMACHQGGGEDNPVRKPLSDSLLESLWGLVKNPGGRRRSHDSRGDGKRPALYPPIGSAPVPLSRRADSPGETHVITPRSMSALVRNPRFRLTPTPCLEPGTTGEESKALATRCDDEAQAARRIPECGSKSTCRN